ncbi:lipoprotein [Propionivibrio sp.]|uniref:LPS translocon maturation chaperone LptM n=1 Tax=Propionivibrio sp. TaxID=2212460 RepID=UPI0025D20244|nr:lipoprotein [Propionivibrio sp.]
MRRHFTLCILLSSIALAACGTRGPLRLPTPPTKTPPAPASTSVPVEPVPADLNTATEAAR